MCRGESANLPIVGVRGLFVGDGEDDTPVYAAQRAESLRSSGTTSGRCSTTSASPCSREAASPRCEDPVRTEHRAFSNHRMIIDQHHAHGGTAPSVSSADSDVAMPSMLSSTANKQPIRRHRARWGPPAVNRLVLGHAEVTMNSPVALLMLAPPVAAPEREGRQAGLASLLATMWRLEAQWSFTAGEPFQPGGQSGSARR